MDETLLLKWAETRYAQNGILTAAHYMANIRSCLGSAQCANTKLPGGENQDWNRAIKEACGRLTYMSPDMIFEGGFELEPGDSSSPIKSQFGPYRKKRKASFKAEDVPKAIMTFDCVITSTAEDRDGDVLESEGAQVDKAMPLLWQHIPFEPIGKLLEVTQQNKKNVKGAFAIANTLLGRDAAELVEFGALRISHGFKPTKFEPRKDDDDADIVRGWHILEYKMMEASVVSIPANEDAIITAFSRSKLHHPFVKSWAGNLRSMRPPMVVAGWDGAALVTTINPAPTPTKSVSGPEPTPGPIVVHIHNTPPVAAPVVVPSTGAKMKFTQALKDFLVSKGWLTVGDMNDDSKIKSVLSDKLSKFEMSAGKYAKLQTGNKKSARLSQKKTKALGEAHTLIKEAAQHPQQPVACRAMLNEAGSLVKSVYKDGDPDDDADEDMDEEDEDEDDDDKDDDDEDDDKDDDDEEDEDDEADDEEGDEDEDGKASKGKKRKGKAAKVKTVRFNVKTICSKALTSDIIVSAMVKLNNPDCTSDPALVGQLLAACKKYLKLS